MGWLANGQVSGDLAQWRMKAVPDLPGVYGPIWTKESGGMPQTSSLAVYFSPMTDEMNYDRLLVREHLAQDTLVAGPELE